MTIRIAMWSGPRNLSTAMMRSFGSRKDVFVSDEPFYGCFLKTTGADHPMLTIEGCTTGAKDVPTVSDSATEPWIEVASYRDLKERCDK